LSAAPQQRAPLATNYPFKAFNADETIVTINATLRGESERCYVYVENGQEGTTNWEAIADFFTARVWEEDTRLFGEPYIVTNTSPKIVILYYRMKNDKGSEEKNILGFFYSRDMQTSGAIPGNEYSNGMNIFYMNLSFPYGPNHSEMQRTLFHEFQHMINYSRRTLVNGYPRMCTWMDEGLAESVEHYGLGTYGDSRVKSMNADRSGRLANGCSLTVWTRDADDINYGLAYTFLQYLRLQSTSAGWNILRTIFDHPSGDTPALVAAMSATGGNSNLNTFEKMVYGYHTARFLNADSGLYSFGNERNNFKFTPRSPSKTINSSTKIIAGGALYLPTDDRAALAAYSTDGSGRPSGAGASIRAYPHLP
jgi:hypothetical protein